MSFNMQCVQYMDVSSLETQIVPLQPPHISSSTTSFSSFSFHSPLHFTSSMISIFIINILLLTLINPSAHAKVLMVLMEDDPLVSMSLSGDGEIYKEKMMEEHDVFLETLLKQGSYTKLYSYTHLLNGFAIHAKDDEVLHLLGDAKRVRSIHEDIKMEKLTTYTPEFLEITTGAWPALGGSMAAGEGVVIGLIDTGINPFHPSFTTRTSSQPPKTLKFKGRCVVGDQFPRTACNAKIVGAQYFARAATVAGAFNSTRDFASPFDSDGHGSHTASTAAGIHNIPVIANEFNYGYASGMAPGASIAVYKALYPFGGYMSDVVAAVDQAVEDGVDILSLSIGPASVPPGPSAFLNVLELELLLATKAGVLVVQAVGNSGPSPSSILSFSPWITSVAASMTDRNYNNSLFLGNGEQLRGIGLAPPTLGGVHFPVAAAADVSRRNVTAGLEQSCQSEDPFIRSLARGKLIICTYSFDFESEAAASISRVAATAQRIGAAGFILTMDPDIGAEQIKGATATLRVPGIILYDMESSSALWEYYNLNTIRSGSGVARLFGATARILDGRQASYGGNGPIVALYSSRGPGVNNARLETADVLKPNIMAPGSSIWAAWSPNSEGDEYIKGQSFALLSGTSMATPHVAGIAALIKQKHRNWSPATITSAIMTTANITDHSAAPLLAQSKGKLAAATPFDLGAGMINPSRAIDPGLVFDASFKHYVQFLCAVPGVDDMSIRRAVGVGCPEERMEWCSDLNTASITVSNLVGSRKVIRKVSNVGGVDEKYRVVVREPLGVRVRVSPNSFKIGVNATRYIFVQMEATQRTNAYTFGEMVLQGSKNHVVRVPISVFVSSSLD